MKREEYKTNIVIIGGGFGGLYTAKALANKDVAVTFIDRKNHHTFQPLLYQVATAVLSPGEIASTLRHSLSNAKNVKVLLGEVMPKRGKSLELFCCQPVMMTEQKREY